jgi:hypothetical protein
VNVQTGSKPGDTPDDLPGGGPERSDDVDRPQAAQPRPRSQAYRGLHAGMLVLQVGPAIGLVLLVVS